MKKTIFLMFSVLLLLILFGCGDVKDNNVTPSDTTAVTTEAPRTDTTKSEETTAPPETEKPIIWASEPDPFMIAIVPNPGTVDFGLRLAEALKAADDDTIIAVALAGAYDVELDDYTAPQTYMGKTFREYQKTSSEAECGWLDSQQHARESGCSEEEVDQAEEVITAYNKYLEAYDIMLEAREYFTRPMRDAFLKKLEPYGFKIAYDMTNKSMREYLFKCEFYAVYTISVKDFNEFIRSVGNTEEAYIFCLAMELN